MEIFKEGYLYKMTEKVDSPEFEYEILLVTLFSEGSIKGVTVQPAMSEQKAKWSTDIRDINHSWDIQEIGSKENHPEYLL